ncbi:MAG: 50S ribosomal protein L5 [Patescibacteria group bacterium]
MLKERYQKEVIAKMQEAFSFKNGFQVPRIEKVVVNVGIGKFLKDQSQVDEIEEAISSITGQKPVFAKARVSIAGFKVREGMNVGIRVTLRGTRMWSFLDKLVNVALPRIRDFRGIKKSGVDQGGNLNIGIKEHLVFPEIIPEKVRNIFSLQVTVVSSAKNREQGEKLYRLMGFPIEE